MNAYIRKPKESELPIVRKLFLDVLEEIPYYSALAKRDESRKYTVSKLATKLRNDRYSVACALNASDDIVGFLFSHFDDYTIWLDWIGVSRNERNAGIATFLLKESFRNARLRGCHKIWCDCRTTNEPSKAVLEKTGFTKIVEIKNHWYGQDFILWERFV
jgi:RimJ/RimL family protein N-acetyltransferase